MPLWASIGPRTASPTAKTLPMPVWQFSSTTISPRSVLATPQPSASKSSVAGALPTATTNRSKTSTLASPSCSKLTLTCFVFFPFTSAPVTLAPSRISSPCFLNNFSVSLAICASTAGRKSGNASRMTTSAPNRCQTLPSSSPITPAPMIPRRFGT